MKIANIMKEYKYISKRLPVSITDLREFVDQRTNKKNPPGTIRSIFFNKENFYKFNYVSYKHGLYLPKEWKNVDDAIHAIAQGREYIPYGITLQNRLKATMQNAPISRYYIFGDQKDTDAKSLEIVSSIAKVTYINIKSVEEIKVFKLMLCLKACSGNSDLESQALINFLKWKKIDTKKLLDYYKQYRKFKGNVLVTGQLINHTENYAPWNLIEDEFNHVEKAVLNAMVFNEQ